MKILLADDHAILLDGLESLLTETTGNTVVKALSGEFALSHLKAQAFDLLITDYAMPDVDGGILVKNARGLFPGLRILVLSMHDEPHIIRQVMAAGADGYVLKKYAHQELMFAIDSVMSGRQYISQEVSRALFRFSNDEPQEAVLTEREIEVLRLLAEELKSKEIAEKLFISERTVETHRKNLLRKTNSTNTIGLIKFGYQQKLI